MNYCEPQILRLWERVIGNRGMSPWDKYLFKIWFSTLFLLHLTPVQSTNQLADLLNPFLLLCTSFARLNSRSVLTFLTLSLQDWIATLCSFWVTCPYFHLLYTSLFSLSSVRFSLLIHAIFLLLLLDFLIIGIDHKLQVEEWAVDLHLKFGPCFHYTVSNELFFFFWSTSFTSFPRYYLSWWAVSWIGSGVLVCVWVVSLSSSPTLSIALFGCVWDKQGTRETSWRYTDNYYCCSVMCIWSDINWQ